MPTFELTDAKGGVYQIEAPDERAAFDAFSQAMGGSAPEQGSSSLAGVGKSLGVGVAEGGIGLAGLPGDIGSLVGSGVDYAGSRLGIDPGSVQKFKDVTKAGLSATPAGIFAAPGSQDIQSEIEKLTGKFYKPQGAPEELAQKVGQFLPGMVGGPGGMATRFATQVAAPAIASEIGKNVAGPAGEVVGAMAGLGGGTAAARRFQEMAAARRNAQAAPSTDDIIRTAKGQFKSAEDMNLTVTPDFAASAAAKMRADLKGFDPEAQSAVFKAADRLEGLGSPPKPQHGGPSLTERLQAEMNWQPVQSPKAPTSVAMNDVELIRKQLTALKTDTNASVRDAARKAISSLQESQMAVSQSQVLRGNAETYTKTMADAIANYAAGKRSNTVMGKAALGELNAATAGAGANEDNALRQAIKQLARPVNNDIVPKWKRLGFSDAEGAAIERVARGSPAGNTARFLGKFAPTGVVSGAGALGLGSLVGGPAGAVALPAAGYLAKKIGDMSTKKAVATLDFLVRSRSPMAKQVAAQLPPALIEKLPAQTKFLLGGISAQPLTAAQPVPSRSQQ